MFVSYNIFLILSILRRVRMYACAYVCVRCACMKMQVQLFFYLDVLLLWFNDFAASIYTSIYPGASGARVNSNFYIFLYLSTNNACFHENNKVITFYIPGHGPYVFCGVSVVMAVGRARGVLGPKGEKRGPHFLPQLYYLMISPFPMGGEWPIHPKYFLFYFS